jgi:hypothetical protein
LEGSIIAVIMLAFLVGGRAWVYDIAQFHGVAVSMLVIVAIVVIYAFRRNFLAGGPTARLAATRDAAFLAAIGTAIAFVIVPARWSLGATVAGVEFGLIVELFARLRRPGSERSS